jgi:hypothetical protein
MRACLYLRISAQMNGIIDTILIDTVGDIMVGLVMMLTIV